MSLHGYPCLDIIVDIHTGMDNWRLSSENHGYPCLYPCIFLYPCMDMLWILGPGKYVGCLVPPLHGFPHGYTCFSMDIHKNIYGSRYQVDKVIHGSTDDAQIISVDEDSWLARIKGWQLMISGVQRPWYPADILDIRMSHSVETWPFSAIFQVFYSLTTVSTDILLVFRYIQLVFFIICWNLSDI